MHIGMGWELTNRVARMRYGYTQDNYRNSVDIILAHCFEQKQS